jgi:Cu/Ag efflux pump CusA
VFPLIIERSLQARFLVPMAVSLGIGVVVATFIIMVLVPALTMLQHDTGVKLRAWRARRRGAAAVDVAPELGSA